MTKSNVIPKGRPRATNKRPAVKVFSWNNITKAKGNEPLLVAELPHPFYMFGNKGAVWSDKAHLAQSGDGTHLTLCGTPMLSTNWARIEDVKSIGCPECLAAYSKLRWDVLSPDGFSITIEDTYATPTAAREAANAWASNFEAQGYYSSPKGRIAVEDIPSYCRVIPVRQSIDEEDAEE